MFQDWEPVLNTPDSLWGRCGDRQFTFSYDLLTLEVINEFYLLFVFETESLDSSECPGTRPKLNSEIRLPLPLPLKYWD